MSLKQKLQTNLKKAMQAKDKDKLSVLRLLLAAVLTKEKEKRVGFNVKTILSKKIDILAHVDINSTYRIGKYGVNKDAFEKIMLDELDLCENNKVDLIIIDEIGKMEMISDIFCKKIFEILNTSIPVLGVVKKSKEKFLNKIYNLQNINIIEVNVNNREKVYKDVLAWLQNIINPIY